MHEARQGRHRVPLVHLLVDPDHGPALAGGPPVPRLLCGLREGHDLLVAQKMGRLSRDHVVHERVVVEPRRGRWGHSDAV